MKKLYYLLIAIVGVCMVACGNDDGVDNSQSKPEIPEPDKITLSQQTIEVGFESDTYSVNVTSPYSWDAVSKNDWIVVESPTGIAGTEQLSFSIARNEEEKVRKGIILLTNSTYNLAAEFYITQTAFVPEISITPTTLNFSIAGGEESIAVTANFTHKATTDADWLSITKTEYGYTITAPEYLEIDSRSAEVVISNEKYGISEVVNITQTAFVPEISIAPKTLNFSAIGGEESIAVTANFEHKAATDAEWLSITKTEEGYVIKASANPELEERTAEVVISNEKYGISEIIQITQKGQNEKHLIYYTSINSSVVTPYNSSAFSANIILNTYINGIGIIVFDGEVTTIGERAFYNCSNLTSVTIGSSVTTIGNYAFRNCSSLTSVTIPDSVTSIEEGAFGECHSLECFYGRWVSEDNRCLVVNGVFISFAPASLAVSDSAGYTIPDGVTKIGEYAFCGCTLLTYITIPVNVTTIGNYAFDGCRKLSNLYFKEGDKALRQIGAYAFRNTNFLSLNFPSSVTSIGDYAFYDCDSLLSVVIGTGLKSIGVSAFADCSNLHTFACAAYSVPSTNGYDPFASCPYYMNIYVRKGLVSSYKNTWPWSKRSDYIKSATFTEN